MNYRRGDVVLVIYPNSDLKTFKKRPALIIQSDQINTGLSQQIVALITSNINRSGPTRVLFKQGDSECRAMGLLTDSVVVTDNIATILEKEIDRKIGRCSKMDLIDQALKRTLQL
ncbi:MAG: type II toxin-antitoxin system PemK/MazF family toxin [Nitrospirae bacterium]|nr:type II toxin-antitoxin system PemK/MazF family toxin [Nitrospirota bacterium]MBI3604856.1 type II toxin-antitoxin system PemK/MazF family toxin [Nitrospirota bacterium]